MTLTPGDHYVRSADGSLYVVDGRGQLDGSLNTSGWVPIAGPVLVEASGTYPARPFTGNVVFVGPADPASAAQQGDVWIDTSGAAMVLGAELAAVAPAKHFRLRRWKNRTREHA